MKVVILTSLKHKGNPRGNGRANALVVYVDEKGERYEKKIETSIENDTRNALALKISVEALKVLIKPCEVEFNLNSKFIKNCIKNGWIEKWKEADWKKSNGKPLANMELWKLLYMSLKIHRVIFI